MQPRRTDSKKWTTLPKDYLENVQSTLKTQYAKHLKMTDVIVEGQVFEREILVRIGFLPNGRLKQHNFEIAMDVPEAKDQVLTKLSGAIDFLGSILNEFFEKDGFENSEYEETLPVLWKPLSDKKDVFHFQYSTINSKLESMADEWLSQQNDDLVQELGVDDMDAYSFAEQYDAETLEKIIELKKMEKSEAIDHSDTSPTNKDHLH